MFLSLLTVTVIGIGAYGLTILNQTGTLGKTYKGFGNKDQCHCNKPMTILLMGVDTGSGSQEDPLGGNSIYDFGDCQSLKQKSNHDELGKNI